MWGIGWITNWFKNRANAKALMEANWDTIGPQLDEHPPVSAYTGLEAGWTSTVADGWWEGARIRRAFPDRIGGTIKPQSITVHTTDMVPGTFDAIVKSWTTKKGAGNAAHFLIGRTVMDGVVQFAPITRNANHAGGAREHGWFSTRGRLIHPNTCSIGIEIDNAGKLVKVDGKYTHRDTGRVFQEDDVWYDADSRTYWHKITSYQESMLLHLIKCLRPSLLPFPEGTVVQPSRGGYLANNARWADTEGELDVVGHATLDPYNKTDPGPQVIRLFMERM
jgi:hypothetical protein